MYIFFFPRFLYVSEDRLQKVGGGTESQKAVKEMHIEQVFQLQLIIQILVLDYLQPPSNKKETSVKTQPRAKSQVLARAGQCVESCVYATSIKAMQLDR